MTIAIGDKLPSATFHIKPGNSVETTTTEDVFAGKTIAMFGLPGAFTPTCHAAHLPGYMEALGRFTEGGVDQIVCLSVNDAHVLKAWADASDADGKILFLADGNADFSKAVGLDIDLGVAGMGVRCQRFSMLVKDGVVTALHIEPSPGQAVETSAEVLLKSL